MSQIESRKTKVSYEVVDQDQKFGFSEGNFSNSCKVPKANAAILKKFQQANKDGFDDELEPIFNFHDSLKERLNFADARQQ